MSRVESDRLKVSSSVGSVSVRTNFASKPRAALVLAHGAGAGLSHPFMETITQLLSEGGITCFRFNFPYMEQGKRRPDVPAVAGKTVEAMLQYAVQRVHQLPLFAGGKSFGGRMTSELLARQPNPNVRGILFFGFPLHPAGVPSTARAEHLTGVNVPMLFLQGTRDALADKDLLEQTCRTLPQASLVFFDGADHSFHAKGKDLLPSLAKTACEWICTFKI
jgi:hypothetical protein